MQIVINLPDTNITEDIIRAAKWEDGSLFDMILRGAMRDAIILPKGHGELIERNKLGLTDFEIVMCDGDYKEGLAMVLEKIDVAPTIIEADEVEE